MNDTENNSTLTHGLLVEDFKKNILNLISKHELDIQSKAVILDYVNIQLQSLSVQQTQIELGKYKTVQKSMPDQHREIIDTAENTVPKKSV